MRKRIKDTAIDDLEKKLNKAIDALHRAVQKKFPEDTLVGCWLSERQKNQSHGVVIGNTGGVVIVEIFRKNQDLGRYRKSNTIKRVHWNNVWHAPKQENL